MTLSGRPTRALQYPMSKVTALIPAAGIGKRMGKGIAKQFLPLGGKPLLAHTLLVFQQAPEIDEIIPILSPEDREHGLHDVIEAYRITKVRTIVAGGRERQDSVSNGIGKLDKDVEIVLIHDGVRPFVTAEMIRECVRLAWEGQCVTVGVPVKDTIKEVDEHGIVQRTLDRSMLWSIQTPQAFPSALLKKAHQDARSGKHRGTDDAALVERAGYPVRVIRGAYENIKITTPEDLLLAEEILNSR